MIVFDKKLNFQDKFNFSSESIFIPKYLNIINRKWLKLVQIKVTLLKLLALF